MCESGELEGEDFEENWFDALFAADAAPLVR